MKKFLILSVLVLFLGSLMALESDPSETVGFVKVSAGIGYTYYAHPFTYYDATHTETMGLDDIIGTQLTAGNIVTADRIIEVGGSYAYLNSTGNVWSGGLASTGFTDNKAYQFKVHGTHSAQDVYLAGTVLEESQTVGVCGVGYTYVAVREAGTVAVADLDLGASGFAGGNVITSDRLIEVGGGYAYYNGTYPTGSWAGSLTSITPGKVYQIKVHATHTGFTWVYDPTTRSDENGFAPVKFSPAVEKNIAPKPTKIIKKNARK